jgi:hypothetical protein
MRLRVAFPILLVASLLAATNPGSRAFPPSFFESPIPLLVATDWMPETATMQLAPEALPRHPAQRATVDLAGWRLYLHSATPVVSGFGLIPAVDPLPAAEPGTPVLWPVLPVTIALPTLVSYRPQAPPV